jgi:apolipoprotein N-acyltransferase
LNRTRAHYLLAIVAGAVLPLAFAPFELFFIAPLSYAALLYVWTDAAPRRALGLSFAWGCASFGFGTYWTFIAVRIIGGAPVAIGVLLMAGLTIVLAAFVAAAGWVGARWFRTRGAVAWLVTLPALFVLAEWLRGWLFTGFGWLGAGYSQTDTWLMGYAPLGGILAMSLAVLVTSGALLTLALGTTRERAAAGAVLVAVWAGGFAADGRSFTTPKQRELQVALAQGNIAQDTKYLPEQLTPMMRTAMNVQYVPKPKLAQPQAKVSPSARRGAASVQT